MKSTITKSDIIDKICEKLKDKERAKVKRYVEDLIELIKRVISSEKVLLISGFGKFEAYFKKKRRGRNPQTEEPILLPSRTVCTFRVSRIFKRELNQQQ